MESFRIVEEGLHDLTQQRHVNTQLVQFNPLIKTIREQKQLLQVPLESLGIVSKPYAIDISQLAKKAITPEVDAFLYKQQQLARNLSHQTIEIFRSTEQQAKQAELVTALTTMKDITQVNTAWLTWQEQQLSKVAAAVTNISNAVYDYGGAFLEGNQTVLEGLQRGISNVASDLEQLHFDSRIELQRLTTQSLDDLRIAQQSGQLDLKKFVQNLQTELGAEAKQTQQKTYLMIDDLRQLISNTFVELGQKELNFLQKQGALTTEQIRQHETQLKNIKDLFLTEQSNLNKLTQSVNAEIIQKQQEALVEMALIKSEHDKGLQQQVLKVEQMFKDSEETNRQKEEMNQAQKVLIDKAAEDINLIVTGLGKQTQTVMDQLKIMNPDIEKQSLMSKEELERAQIAEVVESWERNSNQLLSERERKILYQHIQTQRAMTRLWSKTKYFFGQSLLGRAIKWPLGMLTSGGVGGGIVAGLTKHASEDKGKLGDIYRSTTGYFEKNLDALQQEYESMFPDDPEAAKLQLQAIADKIHEKTPDMFKAKFRELMDERIAKIGKTVEVFKDDTTKDYVQETQHIQQEYADDPQRMQAQQEIADSVYQLQMDSYNEIEQKELATLKDLEDQWLVYAEQYEKDLNQLQY